jgi:hypothetical protein
VFFKQKTATGSRCGFFILLQNHMHKYNQEVAILFIFLGLSVVFLHFVTAKLTFLLWDDSIQSSKIFCVQNIYVRSIHADAKANML